MRENYQRLCWSWQKQEMKMRDAYAMCFAISGEVMNLSISCVALALPSDTANRSTDADAGSISFHCIYPPGSAACKHVANNSFDVRTLWTTY